MPPPYWQGADPTQQCHRPTGRALPLHSNAIALLAGRCFYTAMLSPYWQGVAPTQHCHRPTGRALLLHSNIIALLAGRCSYSNAITLLAGRCPYTAMPSPYCMAGPQRRMVETLRRFCHSS